MNFVIIDTNAIIQSLKELDSRDRISKYLKKKETKIVICNEIFEELYKPKKLDSGRWPGFTKNIIIEKLEKIFGDRILDYSTSEEVKILSKSFEEKYSLKGLHYPDSILLAIAKVEEWNNIISGDKILLECCSLENVSYLDQNIINSTTIPIKIINRFEVLEKLKEDYEIKKVKEDIIWIFDDLANHYPTNRRWVSDEEIQSEEKFLKKVIIVVKRKDPIFSRLEDHEYRSSFYNNFYLNILKGISSYDGLVSLLKTKKELKRENIQDLQNLLDM